MTVFNVLSQNCNVFGKKILEASAGTGKTFAIEHIVVRLLIEKNSLISIDQILVVTFTKKATKELKFRIRNNLEKALLFLNQTENNESFDYLVPYINNKEIIFRLQNAIDLFDTAQIFTIHGFCFKNLKEYSLDADVLIQHEPDNQTPNLIKQLIYDYLKFHLKNDEYANEQINILISHYRGMDNLCLKIFNGLDNDQNKFFYRNFNDSYNEFLKIIKTFPNIDSNFILESFNEIEKNYKRDQKFKNDDFFEQLNCIVQILIQKFCTRESFENLLKTKCSVLEFLSDKNKKIAKKNYELPEDIQKIRDNIYPVINESIEPKILLKRLIKDVSFWVNQYLDENEILTYDKILSKMLKALDKKSFKDKVSNKYKAVVIDEFQDTDSLQFKIFDELFFSNQKMEAVYLIGDPKQSIYSFRKADLYTYLNAQTKVDEINYLDTNYRSSKSLIDSLNALFSESYAKEWLKLPQLNKSLTYLPVKSGANINFVFKDNLAPLHFIIAEDACKNNKWPTDEIEQKCFGYIAKEIIKLKNENNFSNNSFAVLVNDRYQAQRLKNYLDDFSIKSITARRSTLKNSNTINAMNEFFQAVLFPNDFNKIKIALKGPYIQINDKDLKNLKIENDSYYIENFYFLKNALKKGLSFFFNAFFYSSWPNKTVLENITSIQDVKFYHETISLIELMISQKNITSNQVLSFLKKMKDFDDEDENFKVEDMNDSGVQILTTFMSKGLEYDIVFALGLINRNNDRFKDNIDEIDAEKMRQFYVALTRAKYRVYLPIAIDSDEKEIKAGSFSCMEYFLAHILQSDNLIFKNCLVNKLDELKNNGYVSYIFLDSVEMHSKNVIEEPIQLSSPKKFNRTFLPSYIYSFSSLNVEQDIFLNEKKEIPNFPSGAETGTLFHNIFEKLFNKKYFDEKNIRKIIHETVFDTELDQFRDLIFDIVFKTINAPLLEENSFCLKDVSNENAKPEVEFLFSLKNNFIKGFIDLVFIYDDKYYIIDWKTNHLGEDLNDYSIENIEKHMNSHNYYLQAAIYTEALKRYLNLLSKDFFQKFGGVFYIFLRGFLFGSRKGIYHFFPDLNLINSADKKNLNNFYFDHEKF